MTYRERRASARAPTDRVAFFWPEGAATPREGRACDISLSGVAIITASPVREGTEVDLELQPRADNTESLPIRAAGRVTRTVPITHAQVLMGVQLRIELACRPILPPLTAAVTLQGADDRADRSGGPADTPQAPSLRRRFRYAPLILILLLLFGVSWHKRPASDSGSLASSSQAQPNLLRAGDDAPIGGGRARPSARAAFERVVPPELLLLDRVPALPDLSGMMPRDSSPVPAQPAEPQGDRAHAANALVGPGARVQHLLALAQAAWLSGEPDQALDIVAQANAIPSAAPLWREAVTEMHAAMMADAAHDAVSTHVFRDALELKKLSETGLAPTANPLHLEIDTRAFTLRVVRDGAILAQYPVGLGYDGSTPTGTFEIANKIVNPAWYNRGDTVPAGDPRNPLGSRWMGLGTGQGATSYGIHATADGASIGVSASRGCIRMRSGDAEALFALCSVGTRVRILP
jgi:lipoprotein-anchoring transpeptidase ErfK/SrfK